MSSPVIGIAWPKTDYITSLEKAGARVRILEPARDPLPAALDECDGILLTGGVDVDPAEYGEDVHPTAELDRTRDDYELALARLAMARDMPLLAICRGSQVLNVAAGGSLIQDLPSQQPGAIVHSETDGKDTIAHDVVIEPGTCLSVLLGAPRIAVNSRHHQSVKDAAPGFVISAKSPDGVVEAIERKDAAFCVGVQWHPENFWATGQFKSLFEGLVEAAKHRHDFHVRRIRK